MTSHTNINSDKSEAQLYEVLLYKKKDIIAIQKKLGMNSDRRKGPIEIRNQTALNQSQKGKTLEDSFGLLFDLMGELIDIREDLNVTCQPILTILYEFFAIERKETPKKIKIELIPNLCIFQPKNHICY